MNVKQRILAIRLVDKVQRKSQLAEALGISIINRAGDELSKDLGQEKLAIDRLDVEVKGAKKMKTNIVIDVEMCAAHLRTSSY